VFGLYFLVTIVITIVQLIKEYQYTSNDVSVEISSLQGTFGPGISRALWTYNSAAIKSILVGMKEITVVTGVKINDESSIHAIGIIENGVGNYTKYNIEGEAQRASSNSFFDKPIGHQFPLVMEDKNGEIIKLGTATIYTSTGVVYDRVKHGFYLILINSVLKTLALWLIFFYFARKIIGKPLLSLADATQAINLDDPLSCKIDIVSTKNDEFKCLVNSYNELIEKIFNAQQDLRDVNCNLDNLVKERTKKLEHEVEVRIFAQRDAENANALKSNFIATMSHEIRTPMTSIMGMAKILVGTKNQEDLEGPLSLIVRNCERLLGLINDMLDVSKLEAEKITIENTSINTRTFIFDTIESIKPLAITNSVNLSYHISSDTPEILVCDSTRLNQVLSNLINNAIKFSTNGNVSLNIQRSKDRPEQQLFIVTDTGIGIDPIYKSKLFMPYSQGDPTTTRKFGGTGLGLYICKQMVELMGGKIWFESQLGEGTIFYFTIPINENENP